MIRRGLRAGLVVAASAIAPAQGLLGLEAGDPVDVEIARRRLVLATATAIDAARLHRVLESGAEFQRSAAASVAVHHDMAIDAWRTESSPLVRAILVKGATDAACAEAVATEAHDDVAAAAFVELARRGRVDAELYVAALGRGGCTARIAARHLVAFAVPVPHDVLARLATDRAAQAPLLAALIRHPRASAVAWLEERAAERDTVAGKLEVFAAFPRGALTAAHGRTIVAAAGAVPISLVREAADRLSPPDADALVGAIHRRAADGLDLSVALELLARITDRGERHLLALARVADPAGLELIVDWLARRESPIVDEFVRDALRSDEPVPSFLLRRAGRVVDDAALRAKLVGLMHADDPDRASAAFHALVRGQVYAPEMLDFVFAFDADADETARRARALFDLPPGVLDPEAWPALLGSELAPVRVAAMRQLFRIGAQLDPAHEEFLMKHARTPDPTALVAARLVARLGRPGSVQQTWGGLDADCRTSIVDALGERDEPWALSLLVDDELRDTPEFRATRVSLGDRSELEALLADPARWSTQWLRRRDTDIANAIEPRHLGALGDALFGANPAHVGIRLEIVGWLVRRQDLPVGGLLARAYREDADIGVRELALEGVLLHAEGAPLCAHVDALIGTPLDEETLDLAHAIVGAVRPPLTPAAARSVARILLLAPIGDARAEVGDQLALDPGSAPPGIVIINLASRLLREETSEVWVDAMTAAGRELAAHENRFAAGRARLGRILAELARDPSVRRRVAPIVARLVLASPDASPEFVGPALLVMAERAYERGEWGRAAEAFEAAKLAWIHDAPVPQVARLFLADDDPGAGSIPSAWLAARPDVCRARQALGRGDGTAAVEHLTRAAALAHGDESAESEIRSLREEVRK